MRRQSGFSLIELMVAMSIGFVLIGGAIYVYDEARSTLNINDTLARMQENARWALDVIEPDIRLAGYWGRHTNGVALAGRAGSASPLAVAINGDCDSDWAIAVQTSVAASNNVDPGLGCIDTADYLAGSDTLQLRHASGQSFATAQLEAGRIYIRTHETGEGSLFAGTAEPAIIDGQNNALVAHVYHVRPYSIAGDSLPSLRRQGLTTVAGTPTMIDQEVISGIEDLQVQFGIDRNEDGAVDRYVDPDNAVLATNPRIRAVRVWLRMRADRPEPGFNDTRVYTYADQQFTPSGADADFRRLLVSRTIFLRNESINEGEL